MRAIRRLLLRLVPLAAACATGCFDSSNPFPPADNGDLAVVGTATPDTIRESESVAFSAEATGGTPAYVYRWTLNAGPDEIAPSDTLGEQVTAGPFTVAGSYVYRVVATDAEGRTAVDFVQVDVAAAVRVSLTADTTDVSEGSSVEFTTDVTTGTAPYAYTWSLADGPIELDLSAESGETLRTPPLTVDGDYVFEVTVTDSEGFTATDSATITVDPLFTIDAPALLIVNEPGPLGVSFETDVTVDSFAWSVTQGSATIDEPESETSNVSASTGETLIVALTIGFINAADQSAEVTREVQIVAAESTRPRVLIATQFGDMVFELNADAAPRTTANFLALVDDGFYDGVLFHRNSCTNNSDTGACDPFVLQGGGYVRGAGDLVLKDPPFDPVSSEAGNGLSNGTLYSVAMALSGGNADSAETQFFINLADNAFLDDQNFTVFASVIEGRDVVDAIVAMPRTDSTIIPGEVSQPVEDVIMERVTRVAP